MAGFLPNRKDNLAMSLRNKSLALLMLWGLFSCSSTETKQASQPDEETLIRVSQQLIGKAGYEQIRRGLKDTLNTWVANELKAYLALRLYPYRLDTLICFNKQKDKLVTTLAFQCPDSSCKQENIRYFYGVKVKGRWYYFSGPTMIFPRTDLQTLTSFEQLHQLAVTHIFRTYLKQDKAGDWQTNEKFFGDLTSASACPYGYTCQTQEDWDKAYLYWVADNWKHRDTVKENQ